MTITDFLLARIAEDGGRADDLHLDICGTNSAPHIGGFTCDCGYPTHMLAQCEALRQVVEIAHDALSAETAIKTAQAGGLFLAHRHDAARILQQLALPYADHPDYREEWRP